MTREIKFRAWHTEQKRMFSAEEMGQDQLTLMPDGRGFVNVSSVATGLSQFAGDKMIPMQFTGLKDKNGKDVYESDLLKYDDTFSSEDNSPEEVIFKDGSFCSGKHGGPMSMYVLEEGKLSHFEVVGNQFENPDLLTSKE